MNNQLTPEEITALIEERDALKKEVLICAASAKAVVKALGLDKYDESKGTRQIFSALTDVVQRAMFDQQSLIKEFSFLGNLLPIIEKYKDQI